MARRSRGRPRGGRRPRYSWHGFYQFALITPSDTAQDIFVMYDPIDDDHQEQVTLERIRGHITFSNTTTSGDQVGVGIYVAERDAGGAMASDVDPLGVTGFDIESNNTLWLTMDDIPAVPTGTRRVNYRHEIDIKARRIIEDPKFLVAVFDRVTASRVAFNFNLRCLVREGVR